MRPSGPAWAAVLASAVGCFVFGLATFLCEASKGFKAFATWYALSGSLSGQVGISVLAWGITWAAAHSFWKSREGSASARWVTIALVGAGFVLTFPPVFTAWG